MTQALEESLSLLVTRLTQIQTLLAGETDGFTNPMTTQDDIIIGGVAGAAARLAKGSNTQHLAISAGGHIAWETPTDVGFANPMTTAADLIVGGASGAAARLAKGSDGQVLTVDPATHLLVWATPGTIPSFATPAIVLGTAAAAGVASTVIRSDGTIVAFDATAPTTQAFGDAAAVGDVAFAARRNHKHGMMVDPTTAHVAAADPHTGYLLESLLDAKGDLVVASADNTPSKLTVGADGTRPEADSSQATGIKWSVAVGTDGWIPSGETWTYASADAPTYTFTISGDLTGKYQVGMRVKLTQTTAKYFIITAVAVATGTTTITVYGGTDYTLANAAITLPFYSVAKSPFGFPLDPAKWTVEVSSTANSSQSSPVQNTWYNLGSVTISVPIGAWRIHYEVAVQLSMTTLGQYIFLTTLSTANNSESDVDFSWGAVSTLATNGTDVRTTFREKSVIVAAKTSYFLNTRTTTASVNSLNNRGDIAKTLVRAICAYL